MVDNTMSAAVFYGSGDVRVEQRPIPVPGSGEVLLRVSFAGVCGSDANEYANGPLLTHIADTPHEVTGHTGPLVLGHEVSGYVVDRGPDVDLPLGTLVVSGAGMSCGQCPRCQRGQLNLCRAYATLGLHRNGGLAEYCTVPASICLDVGPYGLEPYVAGLAQPMSIAVHAFRRGEVGAGASILVFGVGGIGAFLLYAACQSGANVTAVDPDPERLQLASRLGASTCLTPDAATQLSNDDSIWDGIYEASGNRAALDNALRLATPGGRLVLVGLQKPDVTLTARRLTLDEMTILGGVAHVVDTDLPEALRLLASRAEGWADVAPIAFPLADVVDAGLAPHTAGLRVKTLIAPGLTQATDNPTASEIVADMFA